MKDYGVRVGVRWEPLRRKRRSFVSGWIVPENDVIPSFWSAPLAMRLTWAVEARNSTTPTADGRRLREYAHHTEHVGRNKFKRKKTEINHASIPERVFYGIALADSPGHFQSIFFNRHTWAGKSLLWELGAISAGRSASWKSWRNSSSIFQFFLADVSTKPQPANPEHSIADSSAVTVLVHSDGSTTIQQDSLSRRYGYRLPHLSVAFVTSDDHGNETGRTRFFTSSKRLLCNWSPSADMAFSFDDLRP